jgi:hypothetical protein
VQISPTAFESQSIMTINAIDTSQTYLAVAAALSVVVLKDSRCSDYLAHEPSPSSRKHRPATTPSRSTHVLIAPHILSFSSHNFSSILPAHIVAEHCLMQVYCLLYPVPVGCKRRQKILTTARHPRPTLSGKISSASFRRKCKDAVICLTRVSERCDT